MQEFIQNFLHLLDAEALIESGGFYLVLLIVFLETGMFFGFFLPGDYLLFLAGLFCALEKIDVSIYILIVGLLTSGILGNYTGYYFGWKTGPMLFKKKDSWLFKKKYIIMAEEFFHKYGGTALIIGRFVPIIRTFAPIFAGIVRMNFRKFSLYNVFGALIWVNSLTLAGYFLGINFPEIINYIEFVIAAFIVISFVPIVIAIVRRKKDKGVVS